MKETIISRFDEVISRHFENLTGTKMGIGGLPLNMATIGCIVLLGGREVEMQNSPSELPERYTYETLFNEAAEMGIAPDDSFKTSLQDMIQKGYFEVDSEGRFSSGQSTITMARLLDRIFPRMAGINLLAFIGQTMEEAITGRTDIEAAISRFDQTLTHHGVPFSKQRSTDGTMTTSMRSIDTDKNTSMSREQILSELYSRNKASHQTSRSSLKVLAGSSVLKRVDIKDISAKKDSPGIIDQESTLNKEESAAENVFSITEHQLSQEVQINTIQEEIHAPAIEESVLINEPELHPESEDTTANNGKVSLLSETEQHSHLIDETGEKDTDTSDDAVLDKIAAFEKSLSLICPICKTNVLKEQSTAAGKLYYICPSDGCNFISWGKPHNIECKRCKNPFLIETTDNSEETILKCPRATCQHRQALNPKNVKLVRKRLVRRRK